MPTTQPYHSGQIYDPNVPTLINEQLKYLDVLCDFNMTRPSEMPKCQALLTQMLAEIGKHDREYFYKSERIDWEKSHEKTRGLRWSRVFYANFLMALLNGPLTAVSTVAGTKLATRYTGNIPASGRPCPCTNGRNTSVSRT